MYFTLFYVQNIFGFTGKLKAPFKTEAAYDGVSNNRLIIFDRHSNLNFLVDTGADISLLPKKVLLKPWHTNLKLFAANGTQINTYGSY